MEIYNEKIRDLLDQSKTDLKVRESKEKGIKSKRFLGVYVSNLSEYFVSSPEEAFKFFQQGSSNR